MFLGRDGAWLSSGPAEIEGLKEEFTPKKFEKEFGFAITTILKPGNRCLIRTEVSWEVMEVLDG